MKPRNYQLAAKKSVFSEWEDHLSTLVVFPTGCGKTILFAMIIAEVVKTTGKKVMVCADREELIFQARDKIKKVTGLEVDIEMGDFKSVQQAGLFHPRADVIVATRQTLSVGGDGGGRIGKFDPNDFALLVIDEADGAVASTYKRIINYFQSNPNLKMLGVTATPDRADEEALGQIFETVAYNYLLSDPSHAEPNAIDDGWLVPVEQYFVSIEMSLVDVRTTAGELNGADLERVITNEKPVQQMVEGIFEIMHGLEPKSLYNIPTNEWKSKVVGIKPKRAIAFTRFVNHAVMLADILNRISSGFAVSLSEMTRKEDRQPIIKKFKEGGISIICNADILTRGYDDDGVEIVFMCAPTKSRSKYAQRGGRATRPDSLIQHSLNNTPIPSIRRGMIARSNKPCCKLVDFVGDSGRHKLQCSADLLAGNVSDEAIEEAINFARKSGKPVRMAEQLEEEEKKQQEIKQRREEEAARKARLVAKTNYKLQRVDPFDVLQIKPVKPRGWDEGKQLSEKCKKIIRVNLGIDPDSMPYAQGMQLVREQIRRWNENMCSFKQAKTLKKFGLSTEVNFEVAGKMIDAIAQNNWRGLPEGFTVDSKSETEGVEQPF